MRAVWALIAILLVYGACLWSFAPAIQKFNESMERAQKMVDE